ncbi:unnamed protein product [Cercospora beticola]|nr:unnamed protein product [Cercospora beticola]
MAEAMAPPAKRRKLSSSSSETMHRNNSTAPDATLPPSYYSSESVQQPCTSPDLPRVQDHPVPTEDVIHHDMKRAAVDEGDLAPVYPRQDTNEVPNGLPTPVVSLSIQIFTDAFTTLTYTPPALPSLPTLPTLPSVPGATTFTNVPSSSLNSSTSASPILTTSAVMVIGNNATATSKTTITVTRSSTSTLFYATLDGGEVSTITRSRAPFTTTLAGEVFTVPGYSDSQSRIQTSQDSTTATATGNVSGAGGAQTYGTPATTAPTSTSTNDSGGGGSSTPPAGTIAGGVVGGAAGLAVIVLIAMLFFRWYRRKVQTGHQALSHGPTGGHDEQSRSGPGMAERAGIIPFAAAVPSLFRHQNQDPDSEQHERGFTRISGRKLPSQWSEGMISAHPPNMPPDPMSSGAEGGRHLTGSSFYRHSGGLSDGSGELSPSNASPESMERGHLRTSDPGTMMMSPGPERQPQVHYGSAQNFSRPGQASTLSVSPPGASASVLRRSETPSSIIEPNRSSRFTEDM